MINSPDNGATEIPGSSNDSLFVFLGGPIRCWWAPGMWDTRIHRLYVSQRDIIHNALSEDFLVYAPHRAWRGPWNEAAQKLNDTAVLLSDAMVALYAEGTLAHGTDEEVMLATDCKKPVYTIYIGDKFNVAEQLTIVKDALARQAQRLGKNV